jgi:hypothetical protein
VRAEPVHDAIRNPANEAFNKYLVEQRTGQAPAGARLMMIRTLRLDSSEIIAHGTQQSIQFRIAVAHKLNTLN